MHRVAGSTLFVLLLTGALWGAEPVEVAIRESYAEGQILTLVPADIDGDGRADLVVCHRIEKKTKEHEAGTRLLSIFFQARPGRFGARPDLTLPFPSDACALLVGDLDMQYGNEIGTIRPDGVAVFERKGFRSFTAKTKLLHSESTFFTFAAEEDVPYWETLIDMDRNGRPDLFLPVRDGYRVLYQGLRGFRTGPLVRLEPSQRFGPRSEDLLLRRFFSFRSSLRRPEVQDLNGDGKRDLGLFRDDMVAFYLQGPDGTFPSRPSRRWELPDLPKSAEGEDGFRRVTLDLADLNEDGRADLVMTRVVGQIGVFESMRTEVIVYLADEKGHRSEEPETIITLPGISIQPIVHDLNGDGKLDLVASSLRTDLWTNLSRAIFESVTVSYTVFLSEGGKIPEAPQLTRDLVIATDQIEKGSMIPYAFFRGDMNGDGISDLIELSGENRLRILPGTYSEGWFGGRSFGFDAGAQKTIRLETSNRLQILDLDGNGRSDIIFTYPRGEKARGKIGICLGQ